MVLHRQLQDLIHHRGAVTGRTAAAAAAAAACWDSLTLWPSALCPLILTMCCCTKSKWLRIHWTLSVLSAVPLPDAVLVSFLNLVCILSNHVFRTDVLVYSSSAFAVHNQFFISVSLYAFNVLLNRHSLTFSHSITLSSWSAVKIWGFTFFFLDCDCDCVSDCDCISG